MNARVEAVAKVREVLDAHYDDPITEIKKLGQTLIEIADALRELSIGEARSVMEAVMKLENV